MPIFLSATLCHLHVHGLQRPRDDSTLGPYDFTLDGGQCTVLSGPSGSGKSLLLRMIVDLDPHQGDVSLEWPSASANGMTGNSHTRAAMSASAWRQRVTYVAAESGWWAETLSEHLNAASLDEARALLSQLGLAASVLQAPIAQLSTGERQRCALLRAIVQKPAFLLLDEPTSALDSSSTLRVEGLLAALKSSGTGLLVVSHQPEQVSRIADRVLHMDHTGRLRQNA